jgi:predicted RND superfamily exporter protein
MAEITASFGGKNITITYPDDLLGKAEEAFVAMNSSAWNTAVVDKKSTMITDDQVEDDIDLTDEEISELRYNFTVGCILDYVKKTIKQYEVQSVIQQAKNTSDENLNQINVEIETESSGPEYV